MAALKYVVQQRLYRSPLFPVIKHGWEGAGPARRRARRTRVAIYRKFVPPGSLCFDVGANMGSRTQAILDLGARVVAVEPQPLCVRTLSRRFGRHPLFTLVPAAVGSELGHTTMQLSRWPMLSTLSSEYVQAYPSRQWEGTCEVRVTTLDALIDVFGVPDFAKVDVEGFEAEVMRALSHPLPALSLEMNPRLRKTAADALSCLDALGQYRVAFSAAETLTLSDWMTVPDMIKRMDDWQTYSDFHCVRQ